MNRSELALYIWDYFFLSCRPARGDEASWAFIERATHRIRESEIHLDARTPTAERLWHARRVRNAARLALRKVELLSTETAPWVIDGLAELATIADDVVHELSPPPVRTVVN